MSLSKANISRCVAAAKATDPDAPPLRVEDLAAASLGLSPAQRLAAFPSPDPDGTVESLVGRLTNARQKLLDKDGQLPSYVVASNALGNYSIWGFRTYLSSRAFDPRIVERLRQHAAVRNAVLALNLGRDLEALSAAILDAACDTASSTQSSRDQGVDVVASTSLLPLDACLVSGGVSGGRIPSAGERVFVLVSSKKFSGSSTGARPLLDRAHVREIVGTWLIQRSSRGGWRSHGISYLSPVQMLLVTTYRMSVDAVDECHALGVQVWNLPQLVYLICQYAPDAVFDSAGAFVTAAFATWWSAYDGARLVPVAVALP